MGVRFSIEMEDVSYSRLQQTLLELTNSTEPPHQDVARALGDAWSIIDSAHRLKGIIQQTPGIVNKDKSPSIRQLLRDKAEAIDKLRNVFQHLNQDVMERIHCNWPLFGILHWLRTNPDGTSWKMCSLMGGALVDGIRPLMIVENRKIYKAELGIIDLQTEKATVSIIELMESIGRIAGDLERSLQSQGDRLPCDSLIRADIKFDEEP